MPEGRGHHVLDLAFLAVSELNLRLLLADARALTAFRARVLQTHAWRLPAHSARGWWFPDAYARIAATPCAWLWFQRLSIPFWVIEMQVCLYEVVNRKVLLPVEQPRTASYNLFELDHRINGPHQHDIADIPGIHAGGKFLRRGQNGRNYLFVVLKVPQVLLAQLAIIRRDALAVVRVFAGFELIDEVAHEQRMGLIRAKHQGLFVRLDL
jgi:hypothetical protein